MIKIPKLYIGKPLKENAQYLHDSGPEIYIPLDVIKEELKNALSEYREQGIQITIELDGEQIYKIITGGD